jgi:hypothetical protein
VSVVSHWPSKTLSTSDERDEDWSVNDLSSPSTFGEFRNVDELGESEEFWILSLMQETREHQARRQIQDRLRRYSQKTSKRFNCLVSGLVYNVLDPHTIDV